jgi:HemY protein
MAEAERHHEPKAIKTAWERISRSHRHLPQFIVRYARALAASGEHHSANDIVVGALRKQWDAQLVLLFGDLNVKDALKQLKTAEGWLQDHGDDPALLLTLGRLSLRNGLWGKARSYLEGLIDKAPTPEAWRLLAEAQEQLGDRDAALRCHRMGLQLATSQSPALLLPAKTG